MGISETYLHNRKEYSLYYLSFSTRDSNVMLNVDDKGIEK